MDEFDFIARCLSPLAAEREGAFGLKDDAATLQVPEGHELIITKDALVEGVHFIGDEPPALIARKALRVNLSDCAAMGAVPHAYMLALMLSENVHIEWLESFVGGLRADQDSYGLSLLGGDTTRTYGSTALSVTLFGFVPKGAALRRSGAVAGDDVYVSGPIGDAALGLSLARHLLTEHTPVTENEYLLGRYQLPTPQLALGQKLRGVATSCIDISDGLVQDLGHICAASEVGATIEWNAIPLSDAVRSAGSPDPETILTGGDDYELLFTLPAEASDKILALKAAFPITRIGKITEDKSVRVVDGRNELRFSRKGYTHF